MIGLSGDDLDIEMAPDATAGAVFSKDRVYRYRLWRLLGFAYTRVLFIMQNPSKAGAHESDMTVAKCCGVARRNEFDFVDVVNLYALVETDSDKFLKAEGRAGPRNDEAILYSLNRCAFRPGAIVCAAWGGNPDPARVKEVLAIARKAGIKEIYCLGTTKAGVPRHPSRLPYGRKFEVWRRL